MKPLVPRDERQAQVDLVADRLAYLVVSYGLLAAVAYRSLARGDAAWDLMGLVLLGGLVGMVYRISKGAVSGRWVLMLVATIGVAMVVGGVLVLTRR
jgi:hypothetical protein